MSPALSMAAFALVTSLTPGPVHLVALTSGAGHGWRGRAAAPEPAVDEEGMRRHAVAAPGRPHEVRLGQPRDRAPLGQRERLVAALGQQHRLGAWGLRLRAG